MFWWRTPRGLRSFGMTQEVADSSAQLAANQGLYNGLPRGGPVVGAVRLRTGQWPGDPHVLARLRDRRRDIRRATVNRRIILIQSVPAAVRSSRPGLVELRPLLQSF